LIAGSSAQAIWTSASLKTFSADMMFVPFAYGSAHYVRLRHGAQ
jgi:hypothetical protein